MKTLTVSCNSCKSCHACTVGLFQPLARLEPTVAQNGNILGGPHCHDVHTAWGSIMWLSNLAACSKLHTSPIIVPYFVYIFNSFLFTGSSSHASTPSPSPCTLKEIHLTVMSVIPWDPFYCTLYTLAVWHHYTYFASFSMCNPSILGR